MRRNITPDEIVTAVLAGNRLALSRAISQVENQSSSTRELLQKFFPHTGRTFLIGITGPPGTGKSTLVTELVKGYRQQGLSVAVLAVDPSSPFSGGALLGDRVRMTDLSGDDGVFIRSMASRGHLGGLAAATADVLLVLDAAGFDRVLVETVGVGQAEVEIAGTAYTKVVVEAPGMGDEVQAIKAGVLEIADLFVVNKAEQPGASRTVTALEMMLQQGRGASRQMHHGHLLGVLAPPKNHEEITSARSGLASSGARLPLSGKESSSSGEEFASSDTKETDVAEWHVPVLKTTATTGDGVPEVLARIEAHRTWLQESTELKTRIRQRVAHTIEQIVHAELNRRLNTKVPRDTLVRLVQRVCDREMDPYAAAGKLLALAENGVNQ